MRNSDRGKPRKTSKEAKAQFALYKHLSGVPGVQNLEMESSTPLSITGYLDIYHTLDGRRVYIEVKEDIEQAAEGVRQLKYYRDHSKQSPEKLILAVLLPYANTTWNDLQSHPRSYSMKEFAKSWEDFSFGCAKEGIELVMLDATGAPRPVAQLVAQLVGL